MPAKAAVKPRRSPFIRILRGLMMSITLLAVGILVLAAYSGNVSPLKHGGIWGIFPLLLQPAMGVCGLLALVQIGWHWRGFVTVLLGFIASAGPCLDVCPLNFHLGSRKAPEGTYAFSLMTYNTRNFIDQRGEAAPEVNDMIEHILTDTADIVCLQEAASLGIFRQGHITAEQMTRLHDVYPHIFIGGHSQAVLSKFPIQPIHLVTDKQEFRDADLNAFRVSLPGGRLLTVFNVHLQSFSLTDDDKELYRELTDLQKQPFWDVKRKLVDKLRFANVERARQTQALLRFIRHYGGPDVIVCGDFNDVSTCYAIRTLEGAGFREVYPTIGFGPIITYNASRFYFGIDHVLYKGGITPLSIEKGSTHASDHYPLTVRLALR